MRALFSNKRRYTAQRRARRGGGIGLRAALRLVRLALLPLRWAAVALLHAAPRAVFPFVAGALAATHLLQLDESDETAPAGSLGAALSATRPALLAWRAWAAPAAIAAARSAARHVSLEAAVGAALLAGAAASVLTQPADVLKTRQQMARAPGAPPATLRAVLAHAGGLRAGLLALYTGTAARVAKRALSTALTWTLYEEMGRGKAGGSSG